MSTIANNQTVVWFEPDLEDFTLQLPIQNPSSRSNTLIDKDPLQLEYLNNDCDTTIIPPILIPENLHTIKKEEEDFVVAKSENDDSYSEEDDSGNPKKSKLRPMKCATSGIKKSERIITLLNQKTLNKVDNGLRKPEKRLCLEGYDRKFHKIFCSRCEFTCKNIDSMMTHSKSHFEQIQIFVPKNDTITKDHEIEIMNWRKPFLTLYQCNLCNEFWKQVDEFIDHSTVHEDGSKLQPHILRFKMDTVYSCEMCEEECESIRMLDVHKLAHTEIVKCDKCPSLFTNTNALETHKDRVHYKTTYACEICPYTSKSQLALIAHKAIHKNKETQNPEHKIINAYDCTECRRTFKNLQAMKNHMRVIHEEVKVSCDICKAVMAQSALRRHMQVHEPVEKYYKCNTCPKAFTDKSRLKRHINTHTGERMFKCETCNKSFNRECNLQMHLSVHTGVKQYMCEACGCSFRVAVSLRSHIAKHHPVDSEKPTCSKS